MSWDRILQDDAGAGDPLPQRVERLFAEQRRGWPALAEGETALNELRTKWLTCDGERILAQVNPARRRSTMAKVDSQSVAARPCFLCPDNMPVEERGVAFEDLVILPNPFPVLPRHCTIAGRVHRPQRIANSIGTLLRLAAALGPELAAFYNGPRCGASAPDHFHFQACSAAGIPLLAQLPQSAVGHGPIAHRSFGRSMIVFTGKDLGKLESEIDAAIGAFRQLTHADDEPLLNLMTHATAEQMVAVLFPRRAHRPSCYFAEGAANLAISPAVLEMAGVLVVTEADQFDRVDAAVARSIYDEISIDDASFEELAATIGATVPGRSA